MSRRFTKPFWIAFIILILLSGLVRVDVAASPKPKEGWDADESNEEALLKYLQPALKSAGGAGRVYLGGPCRSNLKPIPFPRIKVRRPSKGKTGLAAVREIFENSKEVTVTEGRSGMIRINVGNVPSEILQTRIRRLTLKSGEQYTDELAIIAMASTREVEAAMRKLGLEHPVVVVSIHVLEPIPGLRQPHLPKSINNLTLDQALDLVAKTFGSIVICEACVSPRGGGFFDIRLR